jgi:hypothetical protein
MWSFPVPTRQPPRTINWLLNESPATGLTIMVKAAPRFATILCLEYHVRASFGGRWRIRSSIPLIWKLIDNVSMILHSIEFGVDSQRTLAIPIGDADSAEGAMISLKCAMRP